MVAATLSALHQEYGEPMVSPTRTTEAAADVARPLTSRDQEEPGDKGSQSQEIIGTTRCVSGKPYWYRYLSFLCLYQHFLNKNKHWVEFTVVAINNIPVRPLWNSPDLGGLL